MPTRAAHHRAPPPPPRHTTHATAPHTPAHSPARVHAAPVVTASLVDRAHEATTRPHVDGFDPTPRTPYGVRLGGDEHLTPPTSPLASTPRDLAASDVPTGPAHVVTPESPDLRARDVPRAPEHTETPRADARPSIMERVASSFPLFDAIPEVRTFPTGAGGTIGTHDGTTEAAREAERTGSRLDERGRSAPSLPPATLPDPAREDAEHAMDEAIHRADFEAGPGATSAATGGRSLP